MIISTSTTTKEDAAILSAAERTIQTMIDEVTLVSHGDEECELDKPSSHDVTRAAKDLIAEILTHLGIDS